ncbi:MAG: hypothetical protein F4Y02_17650 [Chloroflexi bacterium]|nr:hypothetical protein [Chloroflexota bacterium]
MTRPLLLCDVESALDAVQAYGAPILTRTGYELLDDARLPEAPLQSLRTTAVAAVTAERVAAELADGAPAWSEVAIPQRWLTDPADPAVPVALQTTAFRVLGCDAAMRAMHHALQPFVEEYATGPVLPTVCYGPRVYRPGSVMLMHLDRYPTHELGVSLILDGPPWAMWMADVSLARAGIAEETLSPRQHLIYEGCRLMHGRPTPNEQSVTAAFFHWHRLDASTGSVARGD